MVIPRPGHSVSLLCSVRAVPPPAITWYRLGNNNTKDRISSSDSVSMLIDSFTDGKISFRLVIHNHTEQDHRNYSCNATNFLGSAVAIFSLQDLDEPDTVSMGSSLKSVVLSDVLILSMVTILS